MPNIPTVREIRRRKSVVQSHNSRARGGKKRLVPRNALPFCARLPQWQIPDLTFPLTSIAAFRKKDDILDCGPDADAAAHFENTRHSTALHYSPVGVRRNGRNIVSQEHTVVIRRPRENRLVAGSGQSDILRSHNSEVAFGAK